MSEKPLIILAAGGSGGHVMPALAVHEALSPKARTVLIGTGRAIEKNLIDGTDIEYLAIPFNPVLGKGVAGLIKAAVSAPVSLFKAFSFYLKNRPKLVVGFGGYPSFIPMLAAYLLRIPCFIQEQNGKMGLANKYLSKLTQKMFTLSTAEIDVPEGKKIIVGNPVRKKFLEVEDWRDSGHPFNILFLGGSQGARAINKAVTELLPFFQEQGISVSHQVGKFDIDWVKEAYNTSGFPPKRCEIFFTDVEKEMGAADIVVCRAGAMTASEVSAMGRAAIYVPLKIANAHQYDNIAGLVEAGAAWSVEDDEKLAESLKEKILELNSDRSKITSACIKAKEFSTTDGKNNAQFIADYLLNF